MTKNKLLFIIFNLVLLILLSEGVYHYYYYKISLVIDAIPTRASSGQNQLIWGENGIVETIQIIFIFFSITYFFLFIRKNKTNLKTFDRLYVYLYITGLFYFFFEDSKFFNSILSIQMTTKKKSLLKADLFSITMRR